MSRHHFGPFRRGIAGAAILIALSLVAGCGNDLTFPGEAAPVGTAGAATETPATPGTVFTSTPGFTPTPTPLSICVPTGGDCSLNGDCCSGQCTSPDGIALVCL